MFFLASHLGGQKHSKMAVVRVLFIGLILALEELVLAIVKYKIYRIEEGSDRRAIETKV